MAVVAQHAPSSGDVLAAALWPHVVEVRETHISWVFLAGDRAYKLKKPVTLPFVDYATPDRRWAMCEEEVRLNRRLAPDLYLGVRAVVATPEGGATLAPAGDPDAIDHVVEMRRFDEASTLAALVVRGGVRRRELEVVGRRLAEFHVATSVPHAVGATAALHAALAENADTLLALAPDREFARRAAALVRFTESFFAACRDKLEVRAGAGRVSDGHGDLRAEHILLERGVEVVDCVEWRLRLARRRRGLRSRVPDHGPRCPRCFRGRALGARRLSRRRRRPGR